MDVLIPAATKDEGEGEQKYQSKDQVIKAYSGRRSC